MKKWLSASVCWVVLSAGPSLAQDAAKPIVNPGTPAPDCKQKINVDRNGDLPGYRASWNGQEVCLPFTPTNQLAPRGVSADDFYIGEFSDERVRQKWLACKEDAVCSEKTLAAAKGFAKFEPRDTGTVDKAGVIDFDGTVDLHQIRRPSYFGKAEYREPIAESDAQTYVVEFTVPRDSYEIRHLKLEGEIKLRGWYIKGSGISDDNGQRKRALVIMNNGGGGEVTAIDNPKTPPFTIDAAKGAYTPAKSDGLSEEPGMRHWRGFLRTLNAAGFDVLITDRRGNGISGGQNGFNTAEQANDIFRELEQLDAGKGLKILGPDGVLTEGEAAARVLLDGAAVADIPVVVGGYSRGSYATQWFMQKNFIEDCNFDVPEKPCKPARGMKNVKGAILYGPNSAGLGYRLAGHDAVEGALRVEFNTTYYPDSSLLANVDKWPALQIVKGTWDYVEGLEGSFATYQRAKGLKDISVFLGPHILQTQNPENMAYAGARMVAFATAAVLDREEVSGTIAPKDLKELVQSVPRHWELSSDPDTAKP
jgi:pimeloyl-ACP methyl ester carboxylesterase